MSNSVESKPCPVETGRGFSVKYKNRFLYSKYDPKKSILQIVSSLNILPETLFLCFSPCLGYGLDELASRLPENCLLLGCEADRELFDIAEKNIEKLQCFLSGKFIMLLPEELVSLPEILNRKNACTKNGLKLPSAGTFKRAVRIDFSAGVSFHEEFYKCLDIAVVNSIGRFWKNRITLVKFGKHYCRNLFLNIANLPCSRPINFFKISKPILAAGAGESLEETLDSIKSNRKNYFIIAVDAALKTFKSLHISPDAVVCEESQSVIAPAFSGCKKYAEYAFASLSSLPKAVSFAAKNTCFYTTLFDDNVFLKKLSNLGFLPFQLPPMGSVGLAAVYLAVNLRICEEIPVYVTGMDFSFSAGKTHAADSFQFQIQNCSSNRLNSFRNFNSSFSHDTHKISDKNGDVLITTSILLEYRNLFEYSFASVKNCFDSGKKGLNLGIKQSPLAYNIIPSENADFFEISTDFELSSCRKIKKYFFEEKEILCKLKNTLSGTGEKQSEQQLLNLLLEREYLFLHFPDGITPNTQIQFLKRVRVQIDYFLKIFDICIKILEKHENSYL